MQLPLPSRRLFKKVRGGAEQAGGKGVGGRHRNGGLCTCVCFRAPLSCENSLEYIDSLQKYLSMTFKLL